MGRDALKLSSYQHDAIAHMGGALDQYGYALLVMTMRARKTSCVLETLHKRGVESVLVVCPPNVIGVWEKHLRAYDKSFSLAFELVSNGLLSRKSSTTPREYLVVDECQDYREYSKRTRSLLKLAKHSEYKIALTGTLANHSVLEMHYTLRVLQAGRGHTTPLYNCGARERWVSRWGVADNVMSKYPTWYLNSYAEKEFYKELKKFAFILDPQNVRRPKLERVYYDLTEEQKRVCSDLSAGVTFMLSGVEVMPDSATTKAHTNSKMRQVCSGFMYYLDQVLSVPTLKWVRLTHLIYALRIKGEWPLIIWYLFSEERNILQSLLQTFGKVQEFNAQTPRSALKSGWDFLLCHPKSAGAGLDISHAAASIYTGVSDDFINLKQSEYRIVDQTGSDKTNYFLTGRDSIEEKRFISLHKKEVEFNRIYTKGKR